MRTLLQDLQYGVRVLRRSPGFTILACLALAIGIGANTALFSAVYAVLLKPLPYARGDRLVLLQQEARESAAAQLGVSVKELADYREQNKSFETLMEYHNMNFILLGREPDRVKTAVVSANFFDVLGVKPLLGRTFVKGEDEIGAAPVLVLSYQYWKQHHGGDPNVVGKAFKMNDKMHTVLGVLPQIPQYPQEVDVYMPVTACPFRTGAGIIENRGARLLRVFGTLKPGVSLAQANADTAMIASRFPKEHSENYKNIKGFSATVDSLQTQLTQKARPLLFMLLATAGLVLLISCANVANLALARMTQREYEMAIRVSLGAPRSRLIRQVLTECTLISVAGGALGLLLASVGTGLLSTFLARFTTRAAETQIDGTVLLFTLVISVVTGILFGLAPALNSSRRVTSHLQAGTRSSGAGHSGFTLRNALIVAQVCISFILLVVAGLTLRSFDKLQKVDPGYNAENVLSFGLPNNFTKYADRAAIGHFEQRVQDRLQELPGVTSAAAISGIPLFNPIPFLQQIMIEKRVVDPNSPKPELDLTAVSPNAFKTLGIPLLRGRDFQKSDTEKSEQVATISVATAKRYWGGEDPLGKRVSIDGGQHWLTIVGIVGDVQFYGLDRPPLDSMYVSSTQFPGTGAFVIRTSMDAATMGEQVTKAIHAIDPEQPVTDIKTLMQIRDDSLTNTKVTSLLLSSFAGLALLLAATGLFGVISFLVSQRTREIGIRIALGARSDLVLVMILKQGLRMVLIGLALGIAGALASTGAVKSLMFGVSATDWITFAGVSVMLLGTAVLASYVPARRAARVDPMVTLRES
jgi:putative ABC transport system permease protein